MMNRICLFVFIVFAFVFVLKIPCMAERVYYTPEGTAVKKYSIQRTKKKEAPTPTSKKTQTPKKTQKKKATSKKGIPKQKTSTSKKRPLTAKEKMNAEAAAAVAAGYKVGQTVKVKEGIIYRLAKDPKTGTYTFKRYRRVKKRTAVPETTVAGATAKARADVDEKSAAQARAEAEAILKEQADVKVREEAAEKARLDAEAKRKKEEREKKERRLYNPEKIEAKGRNMNRLKASVSFIHSFFDTKTVITDRMLTDGDPPEAKPIPDGVGQEDTYYTDMHNDLVRIRFGVTDSVELFVDAGIAYDQVSNITDMEPVFGGGFRVNILELDDGLLSGGYLAFSGEYLTGKLKMDYSDAGGLEYLKTTDWQDMTATLESGIVFSKFTIFAGCSYFMYSETITKKQIQPPPDITMLEDELEQQGNLNLAGGIEYHYSPSMHFLLEVRALNRQGGALSFEYRF